MVTDAGLLHNSENSILGNSVLGTASASLRSSDDSDSAHPSDRVNGNIAHHLTSRFGRVIKPVCHLIESMAVVETLYNKDDVQPAIFAV